MKPSNTAGKREKRDVHGVVLLDKPLGLSSNQALQRVRWLLRARKGGHTGSLDPLATGMLPLCFGDATRFSHRLLDANKTYEVDAVLGEQRSTGDGEGEVIASSDVPELDAAGWQQIADRFVGDIEQIPPMYSALKHNGQRLYEIARAGGSVERPARPVTIHACEVLGLDKGTLTMRVSCSKGTYIRTLVEDIAASAGTLAWTGRLRRLTVEPFDQNMVSIEDVERLADEPDGLQGLLLNADAAVTMLPEVVLDDEQCARFCMGQSLVLAALAPGLTRCYSSTRVFLGLGIGDEALSLAPDTVLASASAQLGTKK